MAAHNDTLGAGTGAGAGLGAVDVDRDGEVRECARVIREIDEFLGLA